MNNQRDTIQVLGSLMKKPGLLSQTDKYKFYVEDFAGRFERRVFSSIVYLWEHGAESISEVDVANFFLNINEKDYFEKENGITYVADCIDLSEPDNFDFYYERLKKGSLLRQLKQNGYDTKKLYDDDALSTDLATQKKNNGFEKSSLRQITDDLTIQLGNIIGKCLSQNNNRTVNAEEGAAELIERLKVTPDTGARLQGKFFNTIARGARRGKFYIRAAPTGTSKSRQAVGDACYLAYPICWNNEKNKWDFTGATEKVLYIMTEQEIDEIQTMILAYLSGVNESKILHASYNEEEQKRITIAAQLMKEYNNLYLTEMPDPNIAQIKQVIREMVRQHNIGYVFYDYIFSSPTLLNEFRDLKLREDQVLGMFAAELKTLAVEQNIFLLTSTQTNVKGEDENREVKNESVLRGQIGPLNTLSTLSVGSI